MKNKPRYTEADKEKRPKDTYKRNNIEAVREQLSAEHPLLFAKFDGRVF